jgi:hypothetical protein
MIQSSDEYRHSLTPSERDCGAVDPHGDRIAAERTFVQDLDCGAFQETELKQPSLKLGRRYPMRRRAHINGLDPATESAPS